MKPSITAKQRKDAETIAAKALAEIRRLDLSKHVRAAEVGSEYMLVIYNKVPPADALLVHRAAMLGEMSVNPDAMTICFDCFMKGSAKTCRKMTIKEGLIYKSC